jgi:hypothetical protein
MNINELSAAWLEYKGAEGRANASRLDIEKQIIAITGKRDEGSKTVDADGFKITITGKQTRKMDWAKWEEIKNQIPELMRPVKMKPELDEAGVKYLRENEPEIYALLPMEVKPAKTAVEVKMVGAV